MTEKESSKFKMRIDDESPDLQLQEETDASQVEKLNKRITRISILIPCLIGVIILAAYFDIKNNLSKVNITGNIGVQTLSKELESKFSSLSIREANLEEALGKRVESLEKTTASLQESVKEATTAIRHIRSARKVDTEKTASAITKIDKTLDSIPKDLDKISSDLKNLDYTSKKELMNLSETVKNAKNDLSKMRSDISSLKSAKADQNDLDSALKNQQKIYQIALQQLTTHLEDKIKYLEKKIKELEKVRPLSEKQKQVKPEKALSSSKTEAEKTPSSVPPKETLIPKPGTIIEQDLQQKTPD